MMSLWTMSLEISHLVSSVFAQMMVSAVTTAVPATGRGQKMTQKSVIQRKLLADASHTSGHTLRIAKANVKLHARAAAGVGQQEMKMPVAQAKQPVNALITQLKTKSSLKIEQSKTYSTNNNLLNLTYYCSVSDILELLVLH